MKLNLPTDADKLRQLVKQRIKSFDAKTNAGPGKSNQPIRAVYAGYETSQSGWFALVFDTRPDASHDGEWTAHLDVPGVMLEFPHWTEAIEQLSEKPISLIQHDGVEVVLPADEEDAEPIITAIGVMIQTVLEEFHANGEFRSLPVHSDYWLGIEEFDGQWGWSSENTPKQS